MAEAGLIKREDIVFVLKFCLGESQVKYDEATCRLTVYAGGNPRSWILAAQVPVAFARELGGRYESLGVKTHLFWNTHMCQTGGDGGSTKH